MRFRIYTLFVLCITLLMLGCGDGPHAGNNGDNSQSDKYGVSDDFDPTDLPSGSITENWGIGDKWYLYNFNKHSVAPSDYGWVIVDEDHTYWMHVLRYYNDEGLPSAPSVSIQTWDGDQFGEPRTWQAQTQISKKHVCFNLDTAETANCDGDDWDVLWRTDRRPVPEVGFAIKNPSIYVRRTPQTRIYQIHGDRAPATLPKDEDSVPGRSCVEDPVTIPGAEDAQDDQTVDCEGHPWRIDSIFEDDAKPVVPINAIANGQAVFQITATMQLAEWTVDVDADNDTLTFHARCVRAGYSPHTDCTAPLTADPQSVSIPLGEAGAPWTFVDLCGENSPQDDGDAKAPYQPTFTTQDDLEAGQWPSTETFAVAVQQKNHTIQLWVAPSNPVTIAPANDFEDTTAPAVLWSIPDYASCN